MKVAAFICLLCIFCVGCGSKRQHILTKEAGELYKLAGVGAAAQQTVNADSTVKSAGTEENHEVRERKDGK